jgi:hypothetical protein
MLSFGMLLPVELSKKNGNVTFACDRRVNGKVSIKISWENVSKD